MKNFWAKVLVAISGLILINSINAFGRPSNINVSGDISHGQIAYITGLGFTDGGGEVPVKFDNFESGTVGQSLATNGWNVDVSNHPNPIDSPPVFSNTRSWGVGNQSGYADISLGGDCAAYLDNLNTDLIYVSLQFYYTVSGAPATQKNVRFHTDDGPNLFTSYPGVFFQDFHTRHRGTISPADDRANQFSDYEPDNYLSGQWQRIEFWGKLDPSSGEVYSWLNLRLDSSFSGKTREPNLSDKYNIVILPFYFGNGGTGEMWYDDVYISKSLARVELGDESDWDSCNKREIQTLTAWSNNSITFTVNQGAFQNGDTAYLFVVDADGIPNSQGYPITIGSGGPQIPPPPTDLRVVD